MLCNFGLKSYLWFQIELALCACSILKSHVWFQTKMHSSRFNYRLLTPLEKSLWPSENVGHFNACMLHVLGWDLNVWKFSKVKYAWKLMTERYYYVTTWYVPWGWSGVAAFGELNSKKFVTQFFHPTVNSCKDPNIFVFILKEEKFGVLNQLL